MARYSKGDIVSVNFPFSSEAAFKYRPAVVIASWNYLDSENYLVCMLSTQDDQDPMQMELNKNDTIGGTFQQKCFIRPAYTFAASEKRMQRKICSLKLEKLDAVREVLHSLVDQE